MTHPLNVDGSQKVTLDKQVTHTEEEIRMVLPGVQALFGFQLIAVFSANFHSLTKSLQLVHLFALLLVLVTTLLLVTPAAYHRQVHPDCISKHFQRMASRLVAQALVPLMTAITLDFYVIARMITEAPWMSCLVSIALFFGFAWAWFIFPWMRRRSSAAAHSD